MDPNTILSHCEAHWWQQHAVGMLLFSRAWKARKGSRYKSMQQMQHMCAQAQAEQQPVAVTFPLVLSVSFSLIHLSFPIFTADN